MNQIDLYLDRQKKKNSSVFIATTLVVLGATGIATMCLVILPRLSWMGSPDKVAAESSYEFDDIRIDEHERILLPEQQLVQPIEDDQLMIIQLAGNNEVLIQGVPVDKNEIGDALLRESQRLAANGTSSENIKVVIRASADVASGDVQELIQNCQDAGFEKFLLRVVTSDDKISMVQ